MSVAKRRQSRATLARAVTIVPCIHVSKRGGRGAAEVAPLLHYSWRTTTTTDHLVTSPNPSYLAPYNASVVCRVASIVVAGARASLCVSLRRSRCGKAPNMVDFSRCAGLDDSNINMLLTFNKTLLMIMMYKDL